MTTQELKEFGFSEELMTILIATQSFDTLLVPKKLKVVLERHIPIAKLRAIHPEKRVAIELCLMVASMLVSTINSEDYVDGWKHISSKALVDVTKLGKDNTFTYPKILKLLITGTKSKGGIIEIRKNELGKETYTVGTATKQYRLTETYKVGREVYKIQSPVLIRKRKNAYHLRVIEASKNTIAMNCLMVQAIVDLPTKKQMLERGRELVKAGHKTNKGKLLTMRNNQADSFFQDYDNRSFVEDNIDKFFELTELGLYVPMVGGNRSGGRVADSFTLMPSWIRDMITIDEEKAIDLDFPALHPNLAQNLYGTNKEMITHDIIKDYLGIERLEAKVENLSFFNKSEQQMKKSPLWKYYTETQPLMMERVISEKRTSEYKYKVTSMELFKKETELMTRIIEEVNAQGIYCVYVYDALMVQESLAEEVKTIMTRVAKEMQIKSIV